MFGKRSSNLGYGTFEFYEIIERGAFDDVLNDDVRCLFNHDANLILARSKKAATALSSLAPTTPVSGTSASPTSSRLFA
jgi:phage head maturation protease